MPTVAFARLAPGVDFGAKDGPAELVFLIAAPEGGGNTHLQILTKLARVAGQAGVHRLPARGLDAGGGGRDRPGGGRRDRGPRRQPRRPPPGRRPRGRRRLVAVTSCPTGIAHTYMAAEALEAAAGRAGVEIAVETQGSAGSKPLPQATIDAADAVIFAADVGVRDRGRFAGKPVVTSGVKRPIEDGDAMIAEAIRYADDPNPPRVDGGGSLPTVAVRRPRASRGEAGSAAC